MAENNNNNNQTDQSSMNSVREQKKAEDERSTQNNANNIRNAADVAMASKNPYAMAAGAIVKGADKLTGGKSTELLGKGMTKANKYSPGGKKIQKASNKLNESGASDKIGKVASMKNGGGGGAGAASAASKGAQGAQNAQRMKDIQAKQQNVKQQAQKTENQMNQAAQQQQKSQGEQNSSPSSSDEKDKENKKKEQADSSDNNDEKDDKKKKGSGKGIAKFLFSGIGQAILLTVLPFILMVLPLIVVISLVTGIISDHDDSFGISQTIGEDTGNYQFNESSQEQQMFLTRLSEIHTEYANIGKSFDPVNVTSTFFTLNHNGAELTYNDMTNDAIREIVNSMFGEFGYDEETFKNNLVLSIIPKYLPNTSTAVREAMAEDIINHTSEYYSLIGKKQEETNENCVKGDVVCNYNLKGFSVSGKGNVNESVQLSNVNVQLMQCSTNSPINGEELIPFENYLLGVGHMEFDTSLSKEALKAKFVALRSNVLAKHVASSNTNNTLKQSSDGKWILQISTCSSDPIYCNPSKGCSIDNNNVLHSGVVANAKYKKDPLPEDSVLKAISNEVTGEVITNTFGYVIYVDYKNKDSEFSSLANQGLNYKSILLQVYNQGTNNLGANDVYRASCNTSMVCNGGVSTGEFANWKQYEGPWKNVQMGSSGKTIRQIGCLVTSLAMLIAKSGVPTNIPDFNPGTFVEYLSQHGGFGSDGDFSSWHNTEKVAPSFKYAGKASLSGSKQDKFNKIKQIVTQLGVYAIVEVKGNTGQHWVAIDTISGDTIYMMDPGSKATNMWEQYNWVNTSEIVYYKVG